MSTIEHNQQAVPSAIFVGSIPSTKTSKDLRVYFSKFGEIKSLKYKKKPGKLSNNVAILKLKDQKAFDSIFESLPLVLDGTQLKVKEVLKGSRLAKAEEDLAQRRVYVKNIPFGCEDTDLETVFKQYGDVELCYICKDKRKPEATTDYAFVTFKAQEGADKAKEAGIVFAKSLDAKLTIKGFKAKSKILKTVPSPKKTNEGTSNEDTGGFEFSKFCKGKHGTRERRNTFYAPHLDFRGARQPRKFSSEELKQVSFNHRYGNIRMNW